MFIAVGFPKGTIYCDRKKERLLRFQIVVGSMFNRCSIDMRRKCFYWMKSNQIEKMAFTVQYSKAELILFWAHRVLGKVQKSLDDDLIAIIVILLWRTFVIVVIRSCKIDDVRGETWALLNSFINNSIISVHNWLDYFKTILKHFSTFLYLFLC